MRAHLISSLHPLLQDFCSRLRLSAVLLQRRRSCVCGFLHSCLGGGYGLRPLCCARCTLRCVLLGLLLKLLSQVSRLGPGRCQL